MQARRWVAWWCAAVLAACQVPGDGFGAPAGEAGDPAANPLAGAFYADGGDGDIRARTENSFVANEWSGAKDARRSAAAAPTLAGIGAAVEPAPPAEQRMLVSRGDVHVEAARPEDAARTLLAQVQQWGGYLHSQQGATVVVRLPAAKFEDALAAARELGRVLHESRQANDVTEEFVDLGIRLDTARKARDRLLEVLQKAEKVEDILKVEAELRRLTEEIERMEGRKKFLADQVAMATLSATFVATAPPPPPRPRPPQRSRFHWINEVGADSMLEGF